MVNTIVPLMEGRDVLCAGDQVNFAGTERGNLLQLRAGRVPGRNSSGRRNGSIDLLRRTTGRIMI